MNETDTRERATMQSAEYDFVILTPYLEFGSKQIGGKLHHKYAPDERIAFAREMISRWGMIAGSPVSEDSAGRAVIDAMPPADIVERACDIAEMAFEEFKKRGWLVPLPDLATQEDMARANDARN